MGLQTPEVWCPVYDLSADSSRCAKIASSQPGSEKEPVMRIVYKRCCGMDVHQNSVTACVLVIDGDGEFRKQATKAMAAKLARLIYRMLRYGVKYVNQGAEFYEAQHRKQQVIHPKSRPAGIASHRSRCSLEPRLGVSEREYLEEFREREIFHQLPASLVHRPHAHPSLLLRWF